MTIGSSRSLVDRGVLSVRPLMGATWMDYSFRAR